MQIWDWESLAPSGWHVTYWFNQPELEARLMGMVGDLPSVTLLRGWTATTLTQDASGVDVGVTDTETGQQEKRFRARYVVGADGANSFERQQLDLSVVDKGVFL